MRVAVFFLKLIASFFDIVQHTIFPINLDIPVVEYIVIENFSVYTAHKLLYLFRYVVAFTTHQTNLVEVAEVERLLYHLSDDPEEISSLMEQLSEKGVYEVGESIRKGLERFHGGFADDQETLRTIADVYEKEGYLMDTHTAVAYKVYRDYREETGDDTPALIASTASAYKFASNVASALGLPEADDGFAAVRELESKTGVPVPSGLRDLDQKTVLHNSVIGKDELGEAIFASLQGEEK